MSEIIQSAEDLANDLDCLTRLNTGRQPILLKKEAAELIEVAFAAQRQAGREEMREILTEAMEAMEERRCYLDIWEWKYGERWDKEDAAIRKALSDLDKGATHE